MGQTLSNIVALQVEQFRKKNIVTKLAWTHDMAMLPLWAAMSERPDGEFGKGHRIPMITGYGNAVGPTLSTVVAHSESSNAGSANTAEEFVVTSTSGTDGFNGLCTFDRQVIDRAAEKGTMAVSNIVQTELKGRTEMMLQRLMLIANGKGYGRAATIKAAPTATPHTVKVDMALAKFLPVNTYLQAAQYETTGTLRSATALRVTGHTLDFANKLVTLTLSASPVALSWADGDTLFFSGYRQDAASPVPIVPVGIGAWNPFTIETTGTFFGLSRVGRPDLQGTQIDCSIFSTAKEALIELAAYHSGQGRQLSAWLVSNEILTALTRSMSATELSKVNVSIGPLKIGYKGYAIQHRNQEIPILVDDTLESGQIRGGPWNIPAKAPYIVKPAGMDLITYDDKDGKLLRHVAGTSKYNVYMYSDIQFAIPSPADYICGTGMPTV